VEAGAKRMPKGGSAPPADVPDIRPRAIAVVLDDMVRHDKDAQIATAAAAARTAATKAWLARISKASGSAR
jgi:hypothetical protein